MFETHQRTMIASNYEAVETVLKLHARAKCAQVGDDLWVVLLRFLFATRRTAPLAAAYAAPVYTQNMLDNIKHPNEWCRYALGGIVGYLSFGSIEKILCFL